MPFISADLIRDLPFYLSHPAPCPYLDGREERKLFTQLAGPAEQDKAIMSTLTRVGFRRSNDVLYRPACEACQACVPVRIPVAAFRPSRSLRRVQAANRDLNVTLTRPKTTDDHFALFQSYQKARHADGDMAQMTRAEFDTMVTGSPVETRLLELRDSRHALKGCLILDVVEDGFSAVYSFFAPEETRRSLGTFLVLSLIEATRTEDKPNIYLGYWIEGSRKMAYKNRFQPLERLGAKGWS